MPRSLNFDWEARRARRSDPPTHNQPWRKATASREASAESSRRDGRGSRMSEVNSARSARTTGLPAYAQGYGAASRTTKTEDGGQRTDETGHRSQLEDGGQRTEDRSQINSTARGKIGLSTWRRP